MADIRTILKQRQEQTADLPLALFDPAADILLNPLAKAPPIGEDTSIQRYFGEYFGFFQPIEGPPMPAEPRRDALFNPTSCAVPQHGTWPIPRTCVQVNGVRGNWGSRFQRIHAADVVWLYYIERMGTFSILGAILDDFAANGRFPIPADTLPGAVLETMVREVRSGIGSSTRERHTAYRRCLGWSLPAGGALGLDAVTENRAFGGLFERFIVGASELYLHRRLSEVINGSPATHRASVATLISVRDTIRLLKKALEPFAYGRMYSVTLNGIVWAISGLAVLRDIRRDLGIPQAHRKAEDFVPAAYDMLVGRDTAASAEINRFTLHHECATNARNLLLDIEFLTDAELDDPGQGGPLEQWIDEIEDNVEGYRTAYRAMTGRDLGPASHREANRSLQPA